MQASLITACRNNAATIRTTLNSLLAQNRPAFECLAMDGGSTDATLDTLCEYEPAFAGRLRWISEPDNGLYDALNKGISMAAGEVIGFIHADDFLASSTVMTEVAQAFETHDLDACFGDLAYVRETDEGVVRVVRYWRAWRGEGGIVDSATVAHAFRWGWMPPHPTLFVKRELYEKLGGFRLDHGTAADYELMLRFLVKHRIRVGYVPKVLIAMRTGGKSNATVAARVRANAMDRKAWRTNELDPLPWTRLMKPLRKLPQWLPFGHKEWRVGARVRT